MPSLRAFLDLAPGLLESRPVNPPLKRASPGKGYRFVTRVRRSRDRQDLVILAFSGGGTRAAAFSYGVLEALRQIETVGPKGKRIRMLDEVDLITGVSGGSIAALAYGLHGEKLFGMFESSFLKRDVQRELFERVLSPANWRDWGRSETAAKLYDDLLFHGATYADLERGKGPFVIATATDISTGARLGFHQGAFDFLCADLSAVPLSRAAAASSAVPFALSPVTLNNYGGTCRHKLPGFLSAHADYEKAPRPAARVVSHLRDLQSYEDSARRPFIHLLDGALSDNLGMRGVLEVLEDLEALSYLGRPTPLDGVKRIVILVVNARSSPQTNWDASERPPNELELLIKATGVPIDHYSYDTVETLRDTLARWQNMRKVRQSKAFAKNRDPALARLLRTPDKELYVIDVSFAALRSKSERDYLNNLPTTFNLPAEAVDRLRAAAGTIIRDSRDFRRLIGEAGTKTAMPRSRPSRARATVA